MNAKDASVEEALLEIAKDLLQASDDLAATDPSASAKLAHEAYEIGRDLGIVRNHLDPATQIANAQSAVEQTEPRISESFIESFEVEQPEASYRDLTRRNGGAGNGYHAAETSTRKIEEEGDDDLFRILDRQRAVVPEFADVAPVRKPSRGDKQLTFEVKAPKRSGWFSWMRSRDLHHAG